MSFIWPTLLLSLLAVPLIVALYVRLQRRRQLLAARYGSLGFVQQASGKQVGARRHIPPVLFFIGLTILALALARPQTVISLPRVEGTVVLAFDVSGSMAADDMKPTRMEAAKAAARDFVAKQPAFVRIGVVAFSESGLQVQSPTNDRSAIVAAINRLKPARGTSLGTGIAAALNVIATQDRPTNYYTQGTPEPTPVPSPMPPGVYQPASIVLLTDGENTVAPDPLQAVQVAATRGVRIFTIGVGSTAGTALKVEGFTVQTQLDQPALEHIAQLTGGAYHFAGNEEELQAIYQNLGSQMVIKPEETEITSLFAGGSVIVLLIGAALSLLWFGRVP